MLLINRSAWTLKNMSTIYMQKVNNVNLLTQTKVDKGPILGDGKQQDMLTILIQRRWKWIGHSCHQKRLRFSHQNSIPLPWRPDYFAFPPNLYNPTQDQNIFRKLHVPKTRFSKTSMAQKSEVSQQKCKSSVSV